jgi:hypothetical protein
MVYARAVKRFFDWCEDHHLGLEDIEPIAIAAYIEALGSKIAQPSVKQHLAAIRQCQLQRISQVESSGWLKANRNCAKNRGRLLYNADLNRNSKWKS